MGGIAVLLMLALGISGVQRSVLSLSTHTHTHTVLTSLTLLCVRRCFKVSLLLSPNETSVQRQRPLLLLLLLSCISLAWCATVSKPICKKLCKILLYCKYANNVFVWCLIIKSLYPVLKNRWFVAPATTYVHHFNFMLVFCPQKDVCDWNAHYQLILKVTDCQRCLVLC